MRGSDKGGRAGKRNKALLKAERKKKRQEAKAAKAAKPQQKSQFKVPKKPKAAPLPRLVLPKNIINKLKHILQQYQKTKDVLIDDTSSESNDLDDSEDDYWDSDSFSDDLSTYSDVNSLEELLTLEDETRDEFHDAIAHTWFKLASKAYQNEQKVEQLIQFNKVNFGIESDLKSDPLDFYRVTEEQMHQQRRDEQELVKEMMDATGEKYHFDAHFWTVSVQMDIPQQLLNRNHQQEGDSVPNAHVSTEFTLEIHISTASRYPYQQPVIVVMCKEKDLDHITLMNLTVGLQKKAENDWFGQPLLLEAYWWLKGNHAQSLMRYSPSSYILPEAYEAWINSKTLEKTIAPEDKVSRLAEDIDKITLDSIPPKETNKPSLDSPAEGSAAYQPLVIKDEEALCQKLHDAFLELQKTPNYHKMQPIRQQLPAWSLKDTILSTIAANQVVVICGETGCGKSTQVPQFILDQSLLSKNGARCNIMVTQPRRISAIGLAERVSSERGERVGASVGYSIRLESRASDSTKLLYCTTGILLRKLELGSDGENNFLKDVSHVVVDEVHERSIDSDFLLMILRDILTIRRDLKLVLMSATVNSNLFADYFGPGTPVIHIPGRTFPVEVLYLEDALVKTGYEPQGEFAKEGPQAVKVRSKDKSGKRESQSAVNVDVLPDEDIDQATMIKRYPKHPKAVIQNLMKMETSKIQYPLLEQLVIMYARELLGQPPEKKVPGRGGKWSRGSKGRGNGRGSDSPVNNHHSSAPNLSDFSKQQKYRGILVFLPGYAEISTLHEALIGNPLIRDMTGNGKYCFALHSTLSSEEQKRVFQNPPDGVVKVIISTNVAETSITIDDVVLVLDAGKMKETRFDPMKGMVSLDECWVSKANAIQRRGRAGRVSTGKCIHLFTSHKFEHILQAQQLPEMHRAPLEQLCLRIKILPFLNGKIAQILERVIEPPSLDAVRAAIKMLQGIQALTKEETLTPLGFHLGRLPVDVRIGKLLLLGCIFGCLDPMLTIAAIMSNRSPFSAPFDKRHLVEEKKDAFKWGNSDFLTLVHVYNEWQSVKKEGYTVEKKFLWDNFLSGKTLNMISSIKRQFAELLSDIGFIKTKLTCREMERTGGKKSDGVVEALEAENLNLRHDDEYIMKALLVSALYPNVVKLETISGKVTLMIRGDEDICIHPTSIHWKTKQYLPYRFLVFLEKVRTTRVYLRDATIVDGLALALFGGQLTQKGDKLFMDDGWIKFSAEPKVSILLKSIRLALDEVLASKIADPCVDLTKIPLIDAIIAIVSSQGKRI